MLVICVFLWMTTWHEATSDCALPNRVRVMSYLRGSRYKLDEKLLQLFASYPQRSRDHILFHPVPCLK